LALLEEEFFELMSKNSLWGQKTANLLKLEKVDDRRSTPLVRFSAS
jgi:hypothetical protein